MKGGVYSVRNGAAFRSPDPKWEGLLLWPDSPESGTGVFTFFGLKGRDIIARGGAFFA